MLSNHSRVATLQPWQGRVFRLLGGTKVHWATDIGILASTACAAGSLISAEEVDPPFVRVADRCRAPGCRGKWERYAKGATP